jgi:hypothetical protein
MIALPATVDGRSARRFGIQLRRRMPVPDATVASPVHMAAR